MRVVTCEWKIERERVKGDVATFYSFRNILAIDIVSRLKQMTKKFHSLNQNYLFTSLVNQASGTLNSIGSYLIR